MEKKDNFEQTYRTLEKELSFMPIDQFRVLDEFNKKMVINYAKTKHSKKRLIAEVTEVRGACPAEFKKGDKLVFDMLGMLLPDETFTKSVCSWLLSDLVTCFASNETLMGYNVEFDEPYYDFIECCDNGPPRGWGHIKVKLSIR